QDLGNCRKTHAVLYPVIRRLEDQRARVPSALWRPLLLLHSYTLAKHIARRGEHEGAACMLLRVACSMLRFPAHTVSVLTSCVIECQRAGLRESAFEYASVFMRTEH
ncbi:hypothetical protein JKP88DRAFT_137309, partial [Tribonema minus]